MPEQKAEDAAENRETRIAAAIQKLDPRELAAYKYTLRTKQPDIAEETAEKLFALYLQGQSCEEIRRSMKGYGLGQIVAARVAYDWDARVVEYRAHLVVSVPAAAEQTHLESVDFMSNLLKATFMRYSENIRLYMATGDGKYLEGVPLPKNMKDFQALMELFLKATGQDKKKVEVTGTVKVNHQNGTAAISGKEAAKILDSLMGDVIDVEAEPVKQLQAVEK